MFIIKLYSQITFNSQRNYYYGDAGATMERNEEIFTAHISESGETAPVVVQGDSENANSILLCPRICLLNI